MVFMVARTHQQKMCSHLNSVHESFGTNVLQQFYNVISVIYNIYVRPVSSFVFFSFFLLALMFLGCVFFMCFLSFFFYFAVRTIDVQAVEGNRISLPCPLIPPTRDKVYMVLWFRDDAGIPLYRLVIA